MNRSTLLVTVLGVVLLGALWWLFLYSPGQDELASVEDEIAAAETEQASLQSRVVALEQVRSRAPETEAALARLRSIVPDEPDLPGALRQIAAAAEDAGVTLEGVVTSRPVEFDEVLGVYSATITLTANGSYFQLVDFLRRVEDPEITARGILLRNLSMATFEYPGLTISLQGEMFSVLEPPPAPADEAATPASNDDAEPDDSESETAESDE